MKNWVMIITTNKILASIQCLKFDYICIKSNKYIFSILIYSKKFFISKKRYIVNVYKSNVKRYHICYYVWMIYEYIYIYSEYMKLLLTQVEKVQCISGILICNEKNVEKLIEKTLWWYLAKYNIFLYFSNFFYVST